MQTIKEIINALGLTPPVIDITETPTPVRFAGRPDKPTNKSSYAWIKNENNGYRWLVGDWSLDLKQSGFEYCEIEKEDVKPPTIINYWTKKGFHCPPFGIDVTYHEGSDLSVIPMSTLDGTIITAQAIIFNSALNKYEKKFRSGIPLGESLFVMGDLLEASLIVFCEGVATGYAIYLSIPSCAVICCMSANRLQVGVQQYLAKYGYLEKPLVIGADNDASQTGENYAKKVCSLYKNVRYVMPSEVGKDFCDLWPDYHQIRNIFTQTIEVQIDPYDETVNAFLVEHPDSFLAQYVKLYQSQSSDRDWLIACGFTLLSTAINFQYYVQNKNIKYFSNIYFLLLGVSGAGKSTTTGRISEIWHEVGGKKRAGWIQNATLGSESGLLSHLDNESFTSAGLQQKCAVSTIIWDESAKLFDILNCDNVMLTGISNKLRNLYTNGVMDGARYKRSKKEDTIQLDKVFFSLLGNGTPDELISSIKLKNLSDGLLPRFLCVYNNAPAREFEFIKASKMSTSIEVYATNREKVISFLRELLAKNTTDIPVEIELTDDAVSSLNELVKSQKLRETFSSPDFEPVVSRYYDLVLKLSLLTALSRKATSIDVCDIALANAFVYTHTRWMYHSMLPNLDNRASDKFVKALLVYLSEHPEGADKQHIGMQRWSKTVDYRDRTAILDSLQKDGTITRIGKLFFLG